MFAVNSFWARSHAPRRAASCLSCRNTSCGAAAAEMPQPSEPDSFLYASAMEMGLSPKVRDMMPHAATARREQFSGPAVTAEWEAEISAKSKMEQVSLEEQLTAQASRLYFDKEFDGAAYLWERALYLSRKHDQGAEKEAALCSNVAAACHSLCEFEEAIARYEAAASIFEKAIAASNRVERWLGDTARTQRRVDYIRHRIAQAAREETPTQGEWLDSDARVRHGSKEDFERSTGRVTAAEHRTVNEGRL